MKTLVSIKPNALIAGFRAKSVYLNYQGNPYGGRFLHEASGFTLDILYFNSVPQASICFDTLPVSDRGEPHALEHIVLGKGAKGRRLGLLEDMSLCESTAATYPDVTAYQFNTAAGMDSFYKLLSAYFDTLLKPDFTDEEAAQELYGAGVNAAGGRLSLEEIGTVYNEMVAESEKPYYTSWRQLAKAVYGKRHPLALESGGAPEALRGMTAAHIRDFHGLRYVFGPNMRVIVGLPLDAGLKGFLGRLNSIISGFLPAQGLRKPPLEPRFPAFRPGSKKTLIGRYPAADLSAAQDVMLAWAPQPQRTYSQLMELSTFLALLADGETSYLYQDLVDAKARKLDFGISGVSFFVEDYPSGLAGISLSDMALANVTARGIGKLRETVQNRVAWLAGGKRREEARIVREKALALLASRKKTMLRFAETQPRFGDRGGGIAWHKHLDMLNREPGFLKSVSGVKEIDGLIRKIKADAGLWRRAAGEAGLLKSPYISAVKPDAGLLKAQKLQKESRIKRLVLDLQKETPKKSLAAILENKRKADAQRNALIDERYKRLPAPPFVKNPPLTLDDTLSVKKSLLGAGVKAVAAQAGATPFLDIGLYFKVNSVSEAEIIYLPAVVSALTGVGVFTPQGEELDYAAMIERSRSEILSLSSFISANPVKGRVEIALGASCGPGETAKAVEWLENCLFRSALSGAKAGRLIDMINEQISGVRNMMQQREEYWAGELASSVFHSGNPVFMALRSPFTELFLLERLRWRLEAPGPKTKGILNALNKIKNAAAAGARAEITKLVRGLPEELKTQFEWYLCRLPESFLCRDMRKMAGYLAEDLNYAPDKAVGELKALTGRICGAANLRIAVTGDAKETKPALELLKTAVARLQPPGKRVKCSAQKNAAMNIKWSGPDVKKTAHAGIVNSGGKSGVIVVSASGVAYSDSGKGRLADFLAIKLLGGSGPHGLFARTCSAGLAYSNGIGANPASGRFGYYAERCPDLEATMKFVADSVKRTEIKSPFLVDYALANSFSDYRGTQDNSSKGHAAACDMEDGITPASVKKFKTALLAFALNKTAALKLLRARLPGAAARVIPGVGRPFPADGSVCGFVCGPEELLAKYENYLKSCGETAPLARLCPSDFWITGRG